MTKAPTPAEMSKGQSDNTNNATKKFNTRAQESVYLQFCTTLTLPTMSNTRELMHRHCGTNNRAPRRTFMDPCKPEVRSVALEESIVNLQQLLGIGVGRGIGV